MSAGEWTRDDTARVRGLCEGAQRWPSSTDMLKDLAPTAMPRMLDAIEARDATIADLEARLVTMTAAHAEATRDLAALRAAMVPGDIDAEVEREAEIRRGRYENAQRTRGGPTLPWDKISEEERLRWRWVVRPLIESRASYQALCVGLTRTVEDLTAACERLQGQAPLTEGEARAWERLRDAAETIRTANDHEQGRRDRLGRIVREEWIAWAKEQPNPKPSWLVPWVGLSEPDREVDRRIGARLFSMGVRAALDLVDDEHGAEGCSADVHGEMCRCDRFRVYGVERAHGVDCACPACTAQTAAMRDKERDATDDAGGDEPARWAARVQAMRDRLHSGDPARLAPIARAVGKLQEAVADAVVQAVEIDHLVHEAGGPWALHADAPNEDWRIIVRALLADISSSVRLDLDRARQQLADLVPADGPLDALKAANAIDALLANVARNLPVLP